MSQEPRPSDAVDRSTLKQAALAGVRWTAVARVVAEVVGLASAVVLAHLVPPSEFGHAAIALIVNAVAIAITSAGFGTPLVQRPEIERGHLQGALLLGVGCGAVMMVATFLLAPAAIGPVFGDRTTELVQLASPLFLLGGIGVVPHALLQRRLDFRRISSVDIVAVITGAAASIGSAQGGLDGEAVIIGILGASVVHNIGLLACVRVPPPAWRPAEMREIAQFGVPTTLSSLTRSGFRNVDYAIVGAALGPAAVGFYWRAFQLGVEYQRKISGIMQRIALPVYSRAATLEDKRAVRARIVRAQAVLIFPLLAFFAVTASTSIPWLFGPAWEPSVVPAQILSVAGMLAAVMTGMGPLVLAVGRPRALLIWDLASLGGFAAAVGLAAGRGLTAVCVAVVAVYAAQLLAAHWFLLQRLVGIPMRSVLSDVAPAAVSSAALVAAALPVAEVLEAVNSGPVALLAGSGLVGAAAYLLALRQASADAWRDLVLVAGQVLPGRRRHKIRAARPVAVSE